MNKKPSRHQARILAMQALYQWSFTKVTTDELISQFVAEQEIGNADFDYFKQLTTGVIRYLPDIETALTSHLDRDITALNPVELNILRVAVYEFIHCPDVPYRVVINEAVEVAKQYGADQGHKYINGVLDALAPELRTVEVGK